MVKILSKFLVVILFLVGAIAFNPTDAAAYQGNSVFRFDDSAYIAGRVGDKVRVQVGFTNKDYTRKADSCGRVKASGMVSMKDVPYIKINGKVHNLQNPETTSKCVNGKLDRNVPFLYLDNGESFGTIIATGFKSGESVKITVPKLKFRTVTIGKCKLGRLKSTQANPLGKFKVNNQEYDFATLVKIPAQPRCESDTGKAWIKGYI